MGKFAPRLRARTIWKSKSLKPGRFGALLEVEVAKICTTPARENGLKVKVLFAWQAQGFRDVSKCVASAGVREGCKNVGRRG